MPKRATQVALTEKEREVLVQVIKRHRSEQQQVLRARIVLAAAEGHSNVQIARDLTINVDTVRLWRDCWVELQGIDLEMLSITKRLHDAPRPGTSAKITAEQCCQIAALACEAPMKSGRPISQWTGREIADELKTREIVELSKEDERSTSTRGVHVPTAEIRCSSPSFSVKEDRLGHSRLVLATP